MNDKIAKIIENDGFLTNVKKALKGHSAYLCGGYLRDLILKNEVSNDRDIVLFNADTERVSRNIADSIGGAFVELDGVNRIYRIVKGEDFVDVAEGLNDSLFEDVDRRDFTINSIFYDLSKNEIYDKNRGLDDLKGGVIRTYHLKNLSDDPLRLLRACRFASVLGFRVDASILEYIKKEGKTLDTVAKERVNQEIVKMFEGKFLPETLEWMHDSGFLEVVFPFVSKIKAIPKNTHHHLDLVHHSIETVRQIRSLEPLLRLSAFYHDIGKPLCWSIEPDSGRHRFIGHDEKGALLAKEELSKLKFSHKQVDYVVKMVKNHIYPSSLMATPGGASNKAMARFVRKIHPDVPDLIELARADRLSARGEAVSDDMIQNNLSGLEKLLDYYNEILPALDEMPKLLDGKEIMEILKIKAGPRLGEIIDELKEAQIEGIVASKDDAIKFVKDKFS